MADYAVNGTGNQVWTQTAGGGVVEGGNGKDSFAQEVQFDPANPGLAYYLENGSIYKSTNANTADPDLELGGQF